MSFPHPSPITTDTRKSSWMGLPSFRCPPNSNLGITSQLRFPWGQNAEIKKDKHVMRLDSWADRSIILPSTFSSPRGSFGLIIEWNVTEGHWRNFLNKYFILEDQLKGQMIFQAGKLRQGLYRKKVDLIILWLPKMVKMNIIMKEVLHFAQFFIQIASKRG